MSNNNFKYTFEQNKQKIITGVSIAGITILGVGLFAMINNNKNQLKPSDEIYVDEVNIRAEYIINGDNNGVLDLLKVETNEVVNSLDLGDMDNVIYSRSNDLEKILAYGDYTFWEITESEGKLDKKEVLKLEAEQPIKKFKFSDTHIVANTGDKLLIFSLKDKTTGIIEVKDVDSMVIVEDTLVYAETTNLHTYNLDTKESKSIEIGDITEDLFEIDGTVVAYNNFGNGNKKSTILKLKSEDLYIEKAYRHDNDNFTAVTPDSDDKDIVYIDTTEKAIKTSSHYKLDFSGEKDAKTKVSLDVISNDEDTDYNSENTVSTKGYLYTNKNGNIEIVRLTGEVLDTTLDSEKTFFMPISREIEK